MTAYDRVKQKVNIMGTCKGAHYITLLVVIILLAAMLYAGKNYAVFYIREHHTGKVVYKKLVRVEESFTLTYIHSVTKQRVDEIFYVAGPRQLAMSEMRYDSFGANLPVGSEQLDTEKTTFEVQDGYYRITYQNRVFEVVPLMVGQVVADHTIVFTDGDRVRLLDVTRGGTYVEIYVTPLIRFPG